MALLCQAQQAVPPETLLLAKIKTRVAENLSRLPNYTCTETIQRSLRFKSQATPEMVDTVRVEVAYVSRRELFGWPGAARIDEPDIGRLIGGSIGNGYFALFSNNIFLTPTPTFHYIGDTMLDGRKAIRYEYQVPQMAGAYRLRSARGAALVGFHGSFWVNPATLDLLRIDVAADDVPVDLGFSAATSELDYGPQTIGSGTFLLPQSAEFDILDTEGAEHRSRLGFRACREFTSQSVVKFGAEPAAPEVTLPDDFTVDLELLTPIDSESSAGGDPVQATLRNNIRSKEKVLVPKGATVSGRIAHLIRNGPAYTLDFTLLAIDFDGGHADLRGRANDVALDNWPEIRTAARLTVARGAHLTLRSRLLKSEEHDSIRP